MHAVRIRRNVILEGLRLAEHRAVRVVAELSPDQLQGERDVLTVGEARALVELGFADAFESDVWELEATLARWTAGRPAA